MLRQGQPMHIAGDEEVQPAPNIVDEADTAENDGQLPAEDDGGRIIDDGPNGEGGRKPRQRQPSPIINDESNGESRRRWRSTQLNSIVDDEQLAANIEDGRSGLRERQPRPIVDSQEVQHSPVREVHTTPPENNEPSYTADETIMAEDDGQFPAEEAKKENEELRKRNVEKDMQYVDKEKEYEQMTKQEREAIEKPLREDLNLKIEELLSQNKQILSQDIEILSAQEIKNSQKNELRSPPVSLCSSDPVL